MDLHTLRFTLGYKLKIVALATALQGGELGAMLLEGISQRHGQSDSTER